MLTFIIENPNPSTFNLLNSLVVKEFQVIFFLIFNYFFLKAKPTNDCSSMSTIHWEIPKVNSSLTWSKLFRKAQIIFEKYSNSLNLASESETPIIKDFSITQNSLEQVNK